MMMATPSINSLKEKLIVTIQEHGPLSISQFMTFCLADPQYGYYITADPFGRDGDFITAPEVSQMFGEMLGVWVVLSWRAMDKPADFSLCEMGPGRGTLMDDVLRTIKKLDLDCFKAANIFLVETSPKLREKQKQRLASHNSNITWIDHFSLLPPMPVILLANELFDCLPIYQYVFDGQNWRETMVGVSPDLSGELDLVFGLGSIIFPPSLPYAPSFIKEGDIIEVSPARESLMDEIAGHIAQYRGAALIIDYGAIEPKPADTLQAMSKHQFSDPLASPGKDDLTSHVDFAALNQRAQLMHCQTYMTTQGEFLLSLGLIERAQTLGQGRDSLFQEKIRNDVERLAGDDKISGKIGGKMGGLFKVLCVSDKNTHIIPFDQQS
ncbi:class I SAM-dependent methyltransferase [Bartonella sp. HY329]|uniref:class I SAM-dependent methyltransferase n=1 Tax=unclassified Bartonella TaxID=2645622 RepID=UPI0021C8DE62|nr:MULTISPECIES: class I SAM-dependent methyltransferase [unclassified Bartonella]UXM95007.1 class I SAM-dependent methyltransferase [Bartonella sp. HY329]UXN09330.1 class I SAM-dependent methyltransferase [Bartonella sp. HY328]